MIYWCCHQLLAKGYTLIKDILSHTSLTLSQSYIISCFICVCWVLYLRTYRGVAITQYVVSWPCRQDVEALWNNGYQLQPHHLSTGQKSCQTYQVINDLFLDSQDAKTCFLKTWSPFLDHINNKLLLMTCPVLQTTICSFWLSEKTNKQKKPTVNMLIFLFSR